MAEDNEKDLSIDDEQSEEVAGGANLNEAALRQRRMVIESETTLEAEKQI
jgi:hypothetical protein